MNAEQIRTPARILPTRCHIPAYGIVFGYLDIYEGLDDGERTSYHVEFRAAPLTEPPRFEMRVGRDGSVALKGISYA